MDMLSRITELLARGETFCLATVVSSDDPDALPGQKAILLSDGTMLGGMGSPFLDDALKEAARRALAEKKAGTAAIAPLVRVFLDILSADVRLLICGAGHIAVPLARFAREMGFKVTVLDDRSDFAHPSRFPGCEVLAENFVPALRNLPLGRSTYVVVITRGHEHDAECLAEILPKETAYVGLIGSRRRVRFVLEMLGARGVPRHRLEEVFTPIGLPIGAESPEEIALSIVSELVCLRRKGARQARAMRTALGEFSDDKPGNIPETC